MTVGAIALTHLAAGSWLFYIGHSRANAQGFDYGLRTMAESASEKGGEMAREPLGTRLRSLRERAGMSQTQLAEKIGTDQGTVSRWERSLAEPPVTMLERIAFALDLSVGALLVDAKPKPPKWE
jgi:ribosome-binding protein aMBF1 (putative translation factor)